MPEDALDIRFDRLRQDLRQDIQASAAETRRHMDEVAEGLRSAIRAIVEGLRALDQKVERFRDEVRQEFAKVDRHFERLEESIALWGAARAAGPPPAAPRQPETCRSPRPCARSGWRRRAARHRRGR